MSTERRGLWITFEGGDGTGKSTQAAALETWLRDEGHSVVRTREPGGTAAGALIRDLVLHHRGDIADRAEALLFAADRAQHVHEVVLPALERGDVVVQDRYLDSSAAYQGAGRVLDPHEVRALSLWAVDGALPDLTVLLDLGADAARARLQRDDKPFDRLETEQGGFHERVRDAFLSFAAEEPERFFVVDAARDAAEISADIRDRVTAALAAAPS